MNEEERKEQVEYLNLQAERLLDRAEMLEAGEELAPHHYSGDPGYEVYCPGCDKHIMEVWFIEDVPFKKYAYCSTCTKTPEEKVREEMEREQALKRKELKMLADLKAKYPDA